MTAFTSKVHQLGKAPKRIKLRGDPRRPESAQHVIEFPGGAVEVSRTTNGDYWAHIIVNRGEVVEDAEGRVSARGMILDGRIGHAHGVAGLPDLEGIEQVAVLIRASGGK